MAFNLKNRHLLSLVNHSEREINYLLDLSRDLKRAKYAGTEQQKLKGKNIALIFEKTSTRTRCAFEVAAYDQGAQVTYIDPNSSQIGHKESMKDTARVLGRMYDAIEYRGFKQEIVDELAEYAGVPVFNGLTDEFHPTQMLADVLTMIENCDKPLSEISYVYIGDARNNMGNSLLLIGAKLGMDVRICGPKALLPEAELVKMCEGFAKQSGARITVTDDIDKAVKGVDFVHTDVWVSMGEPLETWGERIKLLLPYQVTPELMKRTGNPRVKFMHCLPAFHNSETKVGRQIAEKYPELANGIEVTEDVFESPMNVAFEQAENRMHTIKAVLYSSLI
ncbi:ornithine carbamoyltransferase [Aggregatibacter actinomycetemcomitans]|uniref:Ornithine carbamoyltransferase n=2 Tax=Aggregatibacter actinomycetemcomitans TaxID=714 RepID=A0AAC9AHK5_AGGAC|nr:ornithine carbamoyltransferase [Aggregatibacter actinomycetemcomitans]AFI87532.1 ornithine carbamoyltransferase [Aggregatibacter actinomycetemcomitans D7S-1]AMQ93710.1 ornithine carbamoyltransferase [Aggregatibacter actinomycetemcomitans]ANU81291.1 ornithine carbamoyltransferase [Aggregatibacter actinomycetemcomitans]KND85319.1 ornithine carbamoyltransferase [Aggregatibacter actinomycetemcomitans serotype a str. H5P1]KOE31929.1 ornithine carbamoyltransferase [Aggregatibacter actinomycetemco